MESRMQRRWTFYLDFGSTGIARRGVALLVRAPEEARGLASLIALSQSHREAGLLVTHLGHHGAAAGAGLRRGDVITGYDGVPLKSASGLRRLEGFVAQRRKPKNVVVTTVRGGRQMRVAVPAGHLGIIASPLLLRWPPARRLPVGQMLEAGSGDERAYAGAMTMVIVPPELVRPVALLTNVLDQTRNSPARKRIETLLSTAAAIS